MDIRYIVRDGQKVLQHKVIYVDDSMSRVGKGWGIERTQWVDVPTVEDNSNTTRNT